jgi:mevalonate kinase
MDNKFYSHGKLLITGEYFVLEGSSAFAVPVKLGQNLDVKTYYHKKNEIHWETSIKGESWFQSTFNINDLEIVKTSHLETAYHIKKLLLNIKGKTTLFNDHEQSFRFAANIEFPLEWGLGSSSSLISNLAQWANIDPYQLLFDTSKGSGYDVACARANGPIIFEIIDKPYVKQVEFDPNFIDNIFFVYLGKKQNSLLSVEQNWERIKTLKEEKQRISQITQAIVQSKTLEEFEGLLIEHESIISSALKQPMVKTEFFPDFDGVVKSLGAWGGDFVLATHAGNLDYVMSYFRGKGLDIIFPYKELVL